MMRNIFFSLGRFFFFFFFFGGDINENNDTLGVGFVGWLELEVMKQQQRVVWKQ